MDVRHSDVHEIGDAESVADAVSSGESWKVLRRLRQTGHPSPQTIEP